MSNLATGFINDVYSYGNTGSSMANAVSYGAQQNQQDFNASQAELAYQRDIDLASMQMAYNSAAAAEQRAYNEAMWEKQVQANRENMQAQQAFNHAEAILAREFSSEEAQKNRDFQSAEAALAREFSKEEALALRNWQETMSNTSYQRAIEDMKKAGINPILAYAQGGASTPSGGMGQSSTASGSMAQTSMASSGLANSSMASSGMASMGLGSAPNATSGNFTGQGNNMSENLAIIGAIASMFGEGMSGMANALGDFAQSMDLTKLAEAIDSNFGEVLDKIFGDQYQRAKSGDLTPYEEKYLDKYGILPGKSIWELFGLDDPDRTKYNNANKHSDAKDNNIFWNLINKYMK